MQSLRLANDELSNNVEFSFNEVTNSEEVEVAERCDGANDFDWRIDTPNSTQELIEDQSSLADSPCILRRLQYVNDKEPHCPQTFPFLDIGQSSNLLEKLVSKNELNMVSITLFPIGQPYCLQLLESGGKLFQEPRQSMSQATLLDYIDKQELPPSLAEEWDQIFPELFYNGCVVVSLEDLRFSEVPVCRCTILRPHTQSILNDVSTLLRKDAGCAQRDRLSLECSLVNSVQGDLCLDPSVATGIHRLNQHFCDNVLHSTPLCKSLARNEKRQKNKLHQVSFRSMPLFDFLNKKRVKEKKAKDDALRKKVQKDVEYNSSSQISVNIIPDVAMSTRPMSTLAPNNDAIPQLVENCVLKTEQKISSMDHSELSLTRQRPHLGNIVCRC